MQGISGRLVGEKDCTLPIEGEFVVYEAYHKLYQKLYRSLKDDYKERASLEDRIYTKLIQN